MRTIKLNTLLMCMVVIAGITAMCVSATFALYRLDNDAQAHVRQVAHVVKSQLEWQLLKVQNNVMTQDQFPDFYLWKTSNDFSGLCVAYESSSGDIERSLCIGGTSEEVWPAWFESLYLQSFDSDKELSLFVESKGLIDGYVRVSSSITVMLYKAWREIVSLMEVSAIVVVTLCFLLYLSLNWVLKPVRLTRTVLAQMEKGDLSIRLPNFTIHEWQAAAQSINNMVSTLQETLNERKQLSLTLLDMQENERRYLCRELHDELGQSLAGLRAIAYFMEEEVQERCPELSQKAGQISLISQQMMELVKNLLFRLRPADLEELGFTENLHVMIADWNAKHQDKHCTLLLEGGGDEMPASVAVNLLRIVQECLTNIVKHASATKSVVFFKYSRVSDQMLLLRIEDNGRLTNADLLIKPGNGLLGIRERVIALNGELTLTRSVLGGLKVEAVIPVAEGRTLGQTQ